MFQKWQRLRGKKRFQAIYDLGKTWSNSLIVLRGLPNGLEYSRFGFVAGKRLGIAVVRNRVKRRLREAVGQSPLSTGWDLVFMARQGMVKADWAALKEAVRGLVIRARLLGEEK